MDSNDKFYKENVRFLDSNLPESLKIQILERAKQAADKNLFGKLISLKYTNHPNFRIEYEHTPEEWGSDGSVPGYEKADAFWRESQITDPIHVFSQLGWGGIPSRYISGPWEEVLETLYQDWQKRDKELRERQKLEEESKARKLEQDAAAKYGIDWR